ncbi:MAG: radical SAM protein [Candidatus Delongbacteria bacterium]|jgi:molybdenum cofactor biosynthesis enzyme MoaA|nr:radical SAM protein [Candidatus Delongbacteria bacterium]
MIDALYKISPRFLKRSYINAFKGVQYLKYKLGLIRFPDVNKASLNKNTVKAYNRQRPYGYRQQLCYAPFTSMFFSRAGYMSPCYATYGEKSDRWPDKSIKTSWFNGEFENIRQHVANYDLDYACRFCKPVFAAHNFGSLLPNKYESYGINTQAYPKIMEFELSNRCNLECIMCDGNLSSAIRKKREKKPPLPDHYNQNFVEELKAFIPHLQMAEFTGGDPFLIPMYYDIWELINNINPGCQVLITTNANTMSNSIETMLQTYNNLHFNISIDSLNKEHYEQIRRGANFAEVIRNTKRFISYCHQHNTSCNLLVCPLTINSRDFQDLIEFANKHNICVYFHTVVKPSELSLKHQSAQFLSELIEYLKRYIPLQKTTNQRTNAASYASLIRLLETWHAENTQQYHPTEKSSDIEGIFAYFEKSLSKPAFERLNDLLLEYKDNPGYNTLIKTVYDIPADKLEHALHTEKTENLHKQIDHILNIQE